RLKAGGKQGQRDGAMEAGALLRRILAWPGMTWYTALRSGFLSNGQLPALSAPGQCGYIPVHFDCTGPSSRFTAQASSLLAHMAHFVIPGLTDLSSISDEMKEIVPDARVIVQPFFLAGTEKHMSMYGRP